MCLATLDSKEDTIKKYGKEGYGWKLFRKGEKGKLYGIIYHDIYKFAPYKIGKRYRADTDVVIKTSHKESYRSGFHLYTTRREARWNCWKGYQTVRKVKWSSPIASGTQRFPIGGKTIVAKHMTILPLKEKKK
jgi:hypothetical protein